MRDDSWSTIERELRREARSDPELVARIVRRARPLAPAGRLRRVWAWLRRPRPLALSPLHGVAAAAAAVLLLLLPLPGRGPGTERGEGARAGAPVRVPLAAEEVQEVQFVLVAPEASRVSLVGDFNDWDPRATALQRAEAAGVWSVVVPLASGRYLYAFVVDGATWLPDAGAPRGPENEFGGTSSVLLVGESL